MAIQHVFSNTVADGTNTNIVRPSDWNSFHNQLSTISGNTLGGSTLSGTNIVLAGGSNITLSATGNTISIIGNSGGGGGGVAVSAGTDSLFTSGTVVFGNTLNGTFATSNGSIIYSNNFLTTAMASNRGSDFVQATAAFAGTNATGTIGSNGISVSVGNYITTAAQSNQVVNSVNGSTGQISLAVGSSLSSSTNGSSITFGLASNLSTAFQTTGNYLTSQSGQAASGSNGSFAFQTLLFSNANGVSFGTSAGSAITASYTVPNVTNSSWTVSDSATSGTVGRLAFTNLNGVTLSLSSGTGGLHTIVGSVATNYLTTAMASNRGSDFVQATAAFAGTNASGTIGSNGISISVAAPGTGGGGGVAVSAGTASLFTSGTVSFGNTLNGTFATSNGSIIYSNNFLSSQSNQAFSAAGGSSAFQTLSFSDNAYASWTNTGGAVALTEFRGSFFAAGNTTQGSSGTQNIDAVSFAGSGVISVGVTNGSIIISAPATVAGAAPTVSFAANLPAVVNTQTISTGNSLSIAIPFGLPNNISFGFVRGLNTVGFNAVGVASTSIATTHSAGITETHNMHVYSFGTGTNSTVLQFVASTSASLISSININASSNSYSVSQGITFPVSNGTSSFSVSTTAAAGASYSVNTNLLTALSGAKFFDMPFGTSLSAGNYVFLQGVSSTFTASGISSTNLSAVAMVNRPLGLSQINNPVGRFGAANAASIQLQSVVGSFSTVGGATTASIPISAVSSSTSQPIRYLTLQRQA